MLPEKAYLEFQALYKKQFGITLALEDAKIKADNVIGFLQTFHKLGDSYYNKNRSANLHQQNNSKNERNLT